MLNVFITNNHVINDDILNDNNQNTSLKIKEDEEHKYIYLNNRLAYTNKKYGTIIIEIKDEDEINNYLELDDNIINEILYNNNETAEFNHKTIYIIQYQEDELSVSIGIIQNIDKKNGYKFNHKCLSEKIH